MEILLINQNDFLPYRAITANIDAPKRLEPHIVEAQTLDLEQMLGANLYFKVIAEAEIYFPLVADYDAKKIAYDATPAEPEEAKEAALLAMTTAQALVTAKEADPFILLLNGETYTEGGFNKIYRGLKPLLVYLTYKRFVNRDNIRSTAAGFVVKTTMESTPISGKQISEEAARAETDVQKFFHDTLKYMRAKKPVFDQYTNSCCDSENRANTGTRLTAPRNRRKQGNRFCR